MTSVHHAILLRTNSVDSYSIRDVNSDSEIRDSFFEKIGIDDTRELVKNAYRRPFESKEQVFVVRTHFITLESQNALLKLLEEPPESTRFIFILPPDFIVIPTLASRMSEHASEDKDSEECAIFSGFLASGYKDRVTSIDVAVKKKNTEWQRAIKIGLISYLGQPATQFHPSAELNFVARTLLTRGASNKMLLEQVALTLPTRS